MSGSRRLRAAGVLASVILAAAVLAGGLSSSPARAGLEAGRGFIENRGQWPDDVRFVADLGSFRAVIRDDGVWIDLPRCARAVRFAWPQPPPSTFITHEPGPVRWHFYLGDPSRWRSDLLGHDTIECPDLLDGAALCIRAGRDELLFEVDASSADGLPPALRCFPRIDGASRIDTLGDGHRVLSCSGTTLREARLTSAGTRWALRLEQDPAPPLPGRDHPEMLAWSTYLGGTHNEYSQAVSLASDDQPVIAGYTNSQTFPTTPGAYDRTLGGSYDAFVARFSTDGSSLLWATYVGGTLEDRAFDLDLDDADRAIVVGHTYSSDFPATPGCLDRTLGGTRDAFVFALSPAGNSIIWSTYLGGAGNERAHWVRIDSSDRPILAGDTGSADFPVTPGAFDTSLGGYQDGYAVCLSASGDALLYATYVGGLAYDSVNGVALNAAEQVLLTGITTSTDFPVSPSGYDTTPGGGDDAFILLLDFAGAGLLGGTFLGGAGSDVGFALGVDPAGRVHATGGTQSADFPSTPGAHDRTWNGSDDAWYACFDGTLSSLAAATFLGGSGSEFAFSLAIDGSGSPILTGETYSAAFPTTTDAFDRTHGGERDAFVTRLDPTRATLRWSSFLGGNDYDAGWDLEPLGPDRVILTGPTRSLDFPTTAGAYDRTYNGDQQDVWLAVLDWSGISGLEPVWVPGPAIAATPNPFAGALTLRLPDAGARGGVVRIFDAGGRLVARQSLDPTRGEPLCWRWNGVGANGRALPAGSYWLDWQAGPFHARTRVTRVR